MSHGVEKSFFEEAARVCATHRERETGFRYTRETIERMANAGFSAASMSAAADAMERIALHYEDLRREYGPKPRKAA